jgi:site-specific DNA-methyltransferase (adenine-specific)
MGSGSTVAAAEAVGYSALGVEQYREYFLMSLQSIPALSSLDSEGTQLLLQLA